jgi:hypothetical protein
MLLKARSQLQNKQTQIRDGVLIVLGIIIVAFMINTRLLSKREGQYIEQMREFKKQAKHASVYADSLKLQVETQQTVARVAESRAAVAESQARKSRNITTVLRQELDSLKEIVIDSIEMARIIIPKQDSIITQQEVTIHKQDVQIVFLNTALVVKDSALVLSNLRGDSLQTVVDNIPKPPTPPIQKISRKQAFLAGIATGLLMKLFVF